jgi:hypothetical protein
MSYIKFTNDKSYLSWIVEHPNGYVVNVRRNENQSYMVLHKSTCGTIQNLYRSAGATDGGFTEHNYLKICAKDIEDLKTYARAHGRADGSFSKECGRCNPTAGVRVNTNPA